MHRSMMAANWDLGQGSGLEHLCVASPCALGFFTIGLLGSEGKHPERETAKWKPFVI